jgi:molybdate transport system ATP-binding protein
MLEVRIKKRLSKFTLDMAFEANSGITGMLGASGCGKSMTLKCIAGIEKPDEGYIAHNGLVLFDSRKRINLTPQKRRVGYLFQSYALFPNLTVVQNIAFGSAGDSLYIDKLMRLFHLGGLENKRPAELSGGEQQRVALARLLASSPETILLDEPFSALDSHLKWRLEQELMDVLSDFSGTVLMVSHNRDEVYRICDKAAIVSDGHIDAFDNIGTIFDQPQALPSAVMTGCKNISRAQRHSPHHISALNWGITLHTERFIPEHTEYVGIRAHFIELLSKPEVAQNTIKCKLVKKIENPFSQIVIARNPKVPKGTYADIRVELAKVDWLQTTGKELVLIFPEQHLLFLRKEGKTK